jgi:hypothetical protein
VFEHLLKIAALLLANLGCAVLGGVVGSALTGRDLRHRAPEPVAPASEPEDPEDERADEPAGYQHAEWWSDAPTGLVSAVDPSLPPDFGTGMWPVSKTQRLDPLEDETVRVVIAGVRPEGARRIEAPYAWLTRNGNPDEERSRLTRTQELDEVSG